MEDFEIEEMLGITEEDKERFKNFSNDPDRIKDLRKSVSKMISAANLASKGDVTPDKYAVIEAMCKNKYREINRLHDMLVDANIDHIFAFDIGNVGFQLIYGDYYNDDGTNSCSVVEHSFSYGNEEDRLEICGLLTKAESIIDSVAGHLTAEDVFQRIKSHYDRTHDFETAVSFDPLTTEEISRILKSTEEE